MTSPRWSESEFGDAALGDPRRTRRLVEMGSRLLEHPAGKITEVFTVSAEREGAFRFVENDGNAVQEIAAAAHRAAARRSFGQPFVFAPVDQTSLKLVDEMGLKELGAVGTFSKGARGLCVMTALAVLPDGTPVGLCGQQMWARTARVQRKKTDRRRTEDKETQRWLDVMAQARAAFAQEAPSVQPWFQVDAGGDAWPIFLDALSHDGLLTVRATKDRRLQGRFGGQQDYLWPRLERQAAQAEYVLDVPSTPQRKGRLARMELTFCQVVLDLRDVRSERTYAAPLSAVRAREVCVVPQGEDPIEWLLLTTYPVHGIEDAMRVLDGYAARWRIEEFHKIWKTGACRIEDTQLGARDHIERWATLSASVAARLLRLVYLSRTRPELPATEELSRAEIAATMRLRKPRGVKSGTVPTMGQVVRWIADMGGYTGKSSGGPPGAIVIARGLRDVLVAARLLSDGDGEMCSLLRF